MQEVQHTPQLRTSSHSRSPTMRLITATIIQVLSITQKLPFCLRFSGVYCVLAATFQARHWLGKVDLSTTWPSSFANKIAPKCPPSHPNRLFLWPALQRLCSPVLHCPRGQRISEPNCQFLQMEPGLLASQEVQEREVLLSRMLWAPGALGLRPQSCWKATRTTTLTCTKGFGVPRGSYSSCWCLYHH